MAVNQAEMNALMTYKVGDLVTYKGRRSMVVFTKNQDSTYGDRRITVVQRDAGVMVPNESVYPVYMDTTALDPKHGRAPLTNMLFDTAPTIYMEINRAAFLFMAMYAMGETNNSSEYAACKSGSDMKLSLIDANNFPPPDSIIGTISVRNYEVPLEVIAGLIDSYERRVISEIIPRL